MNRQTLFGRLVDAVLEHGFTPYGTSRLAPNRLINDLKVGAESTTPLRLWEPAEVEVSGLYGTRRTVQRSVVIAEFNSDPGWETTEFVQTWYVHVFGEEYHQQILRLVEHLERRFLAEIFVVPKRTEPSS